MAQLRAIQCKSGPRHPNFLASSRDMLGARSFGTGGVQSAVSHADGCIDRLSILNIRFARATAIQLISVKTLLQYWATSCSDSLVRVFLMMLSES